MHLTADGPAVVIHDDLLDRTTDGSGPASGLTAAEIKQLDAGSWWAPHFAGEAVPLLEEVLELTEGRALLHVELKGGGSELLAGLVVDSVRRLGAVHRVIVMSFDLDAVLAARDAGSELTVLAIVGGRLEDQLGFVLAAGLDGLNQAPRRWEPATIDSFHEHGLLVHGSLVNDPAELETFFALGGDMVDSDSPECFTRSELPLRSQEPGA